MQTQVFDTSSMIYAWDNYPLRQFPGLWEWMATQTQQRILVMPSVAYEEVENKAPDCGDWLKHNKLEQLQISNEILRDAMHIKGLLGIQGDKYGPKGVGENDILIIATACSYSVGLVSNEGRQSVLPTNLGNCKIPTVCGMAGVAVPCINFIEFIKQSNTIFR